MLTALQRAVPVLTYLVRWLVLACLVALLAGAASALFLFLLDRATLLRLAHPWLIAGLPLGGAATSWLYLRVGREVEAGNNLLIDEIHDPQKVIPLRMAPLILGATVVSHLFGASVGREGTAVQMGGALADQLTHVFRLDRAARRILLMSGISAGFASVFGTPLAGAVFGLEVLATGRMRYDALFPCMVAAVVADQAGQAFGIVHTHYAIPLVPALTPWHFVAMLLAGCLFGLTGKLFAEATHGLARLFKAHVAGAPLRTFIGGGIIAVLAGLLPLERYLGLGVPVIREAFLVPLPAWDFAAKLGLTVASLASGFKGGEVTPLFYIGATLGNALAPLLDLPFPLLAGMGFVAVFAGAANTPIASTLMAMELFGADVGIYAMLACIASYLFSGYSSIYRSQRIGHAKSHPAPEGMKMADVADWRRRRD